MPMGEWIAITGGCGYVGSHIAAAIRKQGRFKTLLIDRRANLLPHTHAFADKVLEADYSSSVSMMMLDSLDIKAVIHCAANSLVGPSVSDPSPYYNNNVAGMVKLLDYLTARGGIDLVFSSSSSVYGDGDGQTPSRESEIPEPISPYGTSKLIGEMMLADYQKAYGLNSIAFRYFNAVGAEPDLGLGQEPGATHLIARIMESIINDEPFHVYGTNWPTEDGTCVRDYVHVSDIAEAHVMGMDWLSKRKDHHIINIGSGNGHSVMQIIKAVERVTNHKVHVVESEPRAGDPAWRMADTSKITNELGWQPLRGIDQIVSDAYKWYNSDTFKYIKR